MALGLRTGSAGMRKGGRILRSCELLANQASGAEELGNVWGEEEEDPHETLAATNAAAAVEAAELVAIGAHSAVISGASTLASFIDRAAVKSEKRRHGSE
jgi:hypothetical protein